MKVVAFDQSYTRTGIAVVEDKELLSWQSLTFKAKETKAEKRARLSACLRTLLLTGDYDLITVERVRLHREGRLNLLPAIALATLVSCIADTLFAYEQHFRVSSRYAPPLKAIDTRQWKAAVLGKGNATKQDAIDYAKQVFGIDVNEDEADAIAMGIYATSKGAVLLKPE